MSALDKYLCQMCVKEEETLCFPNICYEVYLYCKCLHGALQPKAQLNKQILFGFYWLIDKSSAGLIPQIDFSA